MNKAKTVILNCENIYWGIKDKETVRKVIVEDGVTSLGIGTFTDCRNLTEIELPDSVTVLGLAAFMNCSSLRRIKLPDKVKIIEQSAFMNCSSLAEVELPESLQEIYLGAFYGCVNLSHISLPDSVKMVGELAFGGCGCIDQMIHDYPQLIKHVDTADFRIEDLIDIFRENPDHADYFDLAHNLSGADWASLLANIPHLAYRCPWKKLPGSAWAWLLARQPQFAEYCTWSKLNGFYLVDLLKKQPQFTKFCRWKTLSVSCQQALLATLPQTALYCNWDKFSWREICELFRELKISLSQFKLEYIPSMDIWQTLLKGFYSAPGRSCRGLFTEEVEDAATYMIYKSMDRENAKYFLKQQYDKNNWDFLTELCDISPGELTHVPGKKKIPFYLALLAPDNIFYKFFADIDLKLRDNSGNSVLFPALVHDLRNNSLERFHFLCSKGLDADEKNVAGFSCNDMIKYFDSVLNVD